MCYSTNMIVTLKQIQNILDAHMEYAGEKLSFCEAYEICVKENQEQCAQSTNSGFLNQEHDAQRANKHNCRSHDENERWNIESIEQLPDILEQFCVTPGTVQQGKDETTGAQFLREEYLTPGQDVMVIPYMCNAALNIHIHDYFEMLYVVKGEAWLNFEENESVFLSGEVCMIPPNTRHDVLLGSEDAAFCVLIRKSTFEQVFFEILREDNPLSMFFNETLYGSCRQYATFYRRADRCMLDIFSHIFKENQSKEAFSNENCVNYVRILFVELLRGSLYRKDPLKAREKNEPSYKNSTIVKSAHTRLSIKEEKKAGNMQASRVPEMLGYMHQHYRTVTIKELAQEFHYNQMYVGKLIYRKTGMRYHDVLHNIRMQQAKRLLSYSNFSVQEIAERCGYHSTDHFTRTFRKMEGMTPRDYRKKS